MTLISIAIGLGAGASSVLSRVIGEGGSAAEQQAVVAAGIGLSVVLAAVLAVAVAGFLFIGPLLALLGATGGALADATAFMQLWFGGALFLIVPIVAGGLLRSTGDGLTPALLMAAIAVLNIGLNPVFNSHRTGRRRERGPNGGFAHRGRGRRPHRSHSAWRSRADATGAGARAP